MNISVNEIVQATRGRLCCGDAGSLLTDVSTDSRSVHAESLFIPLRGEHHDGHDFIRDAFAGGARATLMNDGHACAEHLMRDFPFCSIICVEDPLQALGDLACFWRSRLTAAVVAITGSNGKTTTKEMAWSILRGIRATAKNPGNWNNLIGLPLTLLKVREKDEAVLLELGMSARGEIGRLAAISRPDVGLITTIGPAHLEQLKTLDAVQAAKAELLDVLGPDTILILNQDDPRVAALAQRSFARVLTFGITGGDVRAGTILTGLARGAAFDLHMAGTTVPVQLAVPGAHAVINALAAAAIAHALHVPPEAVRHGLETFEGIAGRMEVLQAGPLTIINDAYNANPASMQAALETLASMRGHSRRIAVLGDMLELGPDAALFHAHAGKTVAQLGIERLLVTGAFAGQVKSGALAAGMPAGAVRVYDSVEQVAGDVLDQARAGDVLLLKGSRRMKMETVIAALRRHYDVAPAGSESAGS